MLFKKRIKKSVCDSRENVHDLENKGEKALHSFKCRIAQNVLLYYFGFFLRTFHKIPENI